MTTIEESTTVDPVLQHWLTFTLEEYKALRQEVIASIGSQVQILSFGTATIALVMGPALGLWSKSAALVLIVLFNFFIPVLASTVIMIWFGEVLRMVRAGDALAELEKRINAAGQQAGWTAPALTWECALRAEGGDLFKRFVINFRGVLGAFALLATASIVLGVIRDAANDEHVRALTIGLSVASIVLGLLIGLFMVLRWRSEHTLLVDRRSPPSFDSLQ